MNYPPFTPSSAVPVAAAKASNTKIVVIVVVAVVVGIGLFLGAVAIALGVGLGVGLRKSSESSSSKLSAPTVSCNASTATCGCPTLTPTFSSRLFSGDKSRANSWPWLVALRLSSGITCSGFLITNRHLLTSASCLQGTSTSDIVAYIGISSLSSVSSSQMASISTITYDPSYSSSTYSPDIAILTLTANVTLSSTVGKCCILNDASLPALSEIGVVAGWGETSLVSSASDSLLQAVIQVEAPSTCGLSTTNTTQFCADYASVTTCPADRGGPFMSSKNGAWTCTGIVSGTSSTCNSVGIYTRVGSYYSLIAGVTTGYL